MLKLYSFKMSDEAKMNELLSKGHIAQGAAILASQGEVVIPIEDGKPLTNKQLAVRAMEERNTILLQLLPIYHSQKVIKKEVAFLESEVQRLEDEVSSIQDKSSKDGLKLASQIRSNIDRFKNMIQQKNTSFMMNDSEIKRLEINVEVYNEYIDNLTDK